MNGFTYRSTVAVYGTGYFLPVNKTNRAGAGVDAGDRVTVEIASDDAERTVDVPDDLAAGHRRRPGGRGTVRRAVVQPPE